MQNNHFVRLRWKLAWLPLTIILAIGLLIYSNTWHSPFVFDDTHFIVGNEDRETLDLSLENWFGTRNIPVISLDLNYHFNRFDIVYYHAVNISVHLISAIAIFWLAYYLSGIAHKTKTVKLFKKQFTNHLIFAFTASLIFIAHPIQTQAVTYISQRLASMATLFYILALLFYVKFRQAEHPNFQKLWGGISLAATIAAMNSKEIAITLPVAIILLELICIAPVSVNNKWRKIKINWRQQFKKILFLTPWLITLLIIPSYMLGVKELFVQPEETAPTVADDTVLDKVNPKRIMDVSAETREISRQDYFLTQLNVARKYWQLVVWPSGLNIDHDIPIRTDLANWPTALSLLMHVSILFFAYILFIRGNRLSVFGILFFYLALLPESSIVPIIDVMFEHRVYLPMIGISMIAGDIARKLLTINIRGKKIPAWLPATFIVLIIAALAFSTYRRNAKWENEVTLWSDAVSKSPQKARPYNNLAKSYLDQKMFDKAQELYQKEIELNPESASGHNNLGSIYGVKGEYEKAIQEINRALEIRPDHDGAYNNLGNVYMMQEEYEKSEEAYRQSIELNPKDGGVWRNIGDVLVKQQKYSQAIEAYEKAIKLVPGKALWHSKLGAALGTMGQYEQAQEELEKAISINRTLASAYSNLGNVYFQTEEYNKAIKAYIDYLNISGNKDTGMMNNLALSFLNIDKKQKALEIFNAVLEKDPENEVAKKYIQSTQTDNLLQ